jgi:mono/diheme cytochrome c family protein
MRGVTASVSLALATALTAACGGSSATPQGGQPPSGTGRQSTSRSTGVSALPTTAPPGSGAAIFAQECSVCHSLIGNESLHRPGGDLIGYRLTRQQLTQQTRQMPVKRPLTAAQLAAVVQYVWTVQHHGRPAP